MLPQPRAARALHGEPECLGKRSHPRGSKPFELCSSQEITFWQFQTKDEKRFKPNCSKQVSTSQNQQLGGEAWSNGQEHTFLRAASWGHLHFMSLVKPYNEPRSFVSMKWPREVRDVSTPPWKRAQHGTATTDGQSKKEEPPKSGSSHGKSLVGLTTHAWSSLPLACPVTWGDPCFS